MKKAILAGELSAAKKTFFVEEYDTENDTMSIAAEELKSAGYLLAVAFKINGNIPPEKIQRSRTGRSL